MKAPEHDGEAGAVLVEVLSALTILAVMATLMTTFFGQFRTLSRITEQVTVQSELETTVAHVGRTLAMARNVGLGNAGRGQFASFVGTGSSVHFSAIARRGFFSMALRRVRIFIEPDGDGYRLVETLAPMRTANGTPLPPVVRVVLESDLETLTFEFSDSKGRYGSSWSAEGSLPTSVRITVSKRVGNARATVTSVVPID